jgi:pre-mRNA-splicing factor 18
MDLLKAEIERKRKATAALIDETNPDGKIGKSRFIRQGDIAEMRIRNRIEAQRQLDESRNKKQASLPEEQGESVAVLEAPQLIPPVQALSKLETSEVKYRLRRLMQPITLFGESEEERFQRLRALEASAAEDNEYRLSAVGHAPSHSRGLPETTKEQADADDDDDEDEDAVGSNGGNDGRKGDGGVVDYSFQITHFSKDTSLPKRKVIHKYFRTLLKNWEWDLNCRPDHEKQTAKGKMETKTQKRCKDYIRHLFKLCKRNEIPFDIEEKLFQVTDSFGNSVISFFLINDSI